MTQFDLFAVAKRKAREAEACPECGLAGGHTDDPCPGRPTVAPPLPPLPTLAEAKQERDEAIEQADEAADEAWKRETLEALKGLATEVPSFRSDHIWQRVRTPREPRALAGVLRRAQKLGFIEPTGEFEPSVRRHAAPCRIWRSLLYRGAA